MLSPACSIYAISSSSSASGWYSGSSSPREAERSTGLLNRTRKLETKDTVFEGAGQPMYHRPMTTGATHWFAAQLKPNGLRSAEQRVDLDAIQCESCHGPAAGHPREVKKLVIDSSREQCLRCHALLEYPNSRRGMMKGIDPDKHKSKFECKKCHDPHNPNLEDR